MQHVCGQTGNLGNECADHAAALGTLGLVSSHNLSARWARHSFDTAPCFGSCKHNIGDVLEKLRDIRTRNNLDTSEWEIALCSSPGSLLFARMHRIAFGYLSAVFLSLTALPQYPVCLRIL